jgi:hypothetical protein
MKQKYHQSQHLKIGYSKIKYSTYIKEKRNHIPSSKEKIISIEISYIYTLHSNVCVEYPWSYNKMEQRTIAYYSMHIWVNCNFIVRF